MNDCKDINPPPPFFFYSCLFNALVPVLELYQIDYDGIFFQYVPVFTMSEEGIKITYDISFNLYQMLRKKGLDINECFSDNNMVEITQNAIKDNRPAIVWSDGYYQPNIKDIYHTRHLVHCFLVKGVEKDKFTIIDHSYSDSMYYFEQSIGFDDLKVSAGAYVSGFYNPEQPVFSSFSFREPEKAPAGPSAAQYLAAIRSRSNDIIKGIGLLYEDNFQTGAHLLKVINDMMNYKNTITLVLKKYDDTLYELCNKNLQAWVDFRILLVRLLYTNNYEPVKVKDKLTELRYHDSGFYHELLEYNG